MPPHKAIYVSPTAICESAYYCVSSYSTIYVLHSAIPDRQLEFFFFLANSASQRLPNSGTKPLLLVALTKVVVRIAGIRHYQLDFPANSHPPEPLVQTFLDICDKESVLAVHCRAGLGYTSAYVSIRQHTSAYVSILLAYSKRRALCLSTVGRAWVYYMCLHATKYVSACYYMCPHATICVPACYYICACMLLYLSPDGTICVRMLLHMCPHASACYYTRVRASTGARALRGTLAQALPLESLCRHATIHVVPQRRRCCYNLCVLMLLYMCVLMLLYMCAHTQAHGDPDCAVPHGALRLQGAGGDSMAARRNAWLRARRAATVPYRL